MCAPLFQAWYEFFGSQLSKTLCENIDKNKTYWEGKAKEIEAAVTWKIADETITSTSDKPEKMDKASGGPPGGQSVIEDTEEPTEATAI